jgi:heme exporter protein A
MAVSVPDEGVSVQAGAAPTAWAVETIDLVRKYGPRRALNGLNLRVPWDQRVAVLGPNGAGKSTLLRVLATLARPTSGRVFLGGLALPAEAAAARRHLGLVAHQTFLYDDLTARENLLFYGRLYGIDDARRRADALLQRFGLADRVDQRVRQLSRGLQQRLALARAILHDPPILLLDEPDTGLDVEGIDLLADLMRDEAGRPRTVLLTTHSPERALALADRVIVLAEGHLVLDRPAGGVSPELLAEALRTGRRA